MLAQALSVDDSASMFEHAACGLARTTEEGVFVLVNQTFCNWIGREPDDLIGKIRLQDLLSMGGKIFHQTHWAPLLQMQKSVSEVKLEVMLPSGQSVPMVMNALLRQHHGDYFHDIAAFIARDRDKYERQLLESRRTMEQLVKHTQELHEDAKEQTSFAEQMMGIVSHDLRNPLSTIQMGTELLMRSDPTAKQMGMLGRIGRATARATHLIADLLDLTKARLGKGMTVAYTPVDLRTLIAEAIEELSLVYPNAHFIHTHQGDGTCRGDALRLVQMIGNLVSNAAAYGLAGAPITLTSIVEVDTFCVEVHNHGAPIPAEIQAALFKPMVRGVGELGTSSRSIGLGLFIVSQIVKAHGGAVTLESTSEHGTTFRARIPRDPPQIL